ncbi:hypothetical protein OA248_04730 [Candidatus Pelagibacter sp.]|nr:hypothetical protein [Candidatus Pelagibacter sp.]
MELIIVQSVNDFYSLEKLLSTSTDILVFDQSVMVELDKNDVKYKVVQDFYSEEQYYEDVCIYRKKTENFLTQLDKECETIVNFPYSFSGNEHYLSTWFDDLMYLEKLIQTIQKKYKKVYLYAASEPEKISNNRISFLQLNSQKANSTISLELEKSDKRKIQLIYNSIDVNFLQDKNVLHKDIPYKYRISCFLNRLKSYYDRKKIFKNFNKEKNTRVVNQNIYVFQDAYEITALRKYLPKFNFLNPITKLRQDIKQEKPQDISNSSIKKNLQSFAKEHFFYLNKYFYLIISSYNLEVVGRLSSFIRQFELVIKKDKPCLFLLGSGTRDVFDTVCCHLANKYSIPIIIQQHGGNRIFSDKAYDESLEYNNRVFKTLIVQSKRDVEKFQNNKTKVLNMGSIQQFERNQLLYKKPNKDIFFCLGPDVNFSFRHLLEYYSINKKHQQSLEVIKTAEEVFLSVDIKLHPTGDRLSLKNYINIIKNKKFKKTNIIYGGAAETISRNYKLIIMDFLASAVRKHIFSLKIPVIIYDRDFDKMRINDLVLSDLCNRCYIARNTSELFDLLNRYRAGKLPSKWREDIIDNYIYPVSKGNPGRNIAKYIESISSNKYKEDK